MPQQLSRASAIVAVLLLCGSVSGCSDTPSEKASSSAVKAQAQKPHPPAQAPEAASAQAPETASAQAPTPEATPSNDQKAAQGDETEQTPLDLAVKGLSLSQGENGFELWRLKGEWASMQKEAERITVTEPRLTYFMKDGVKKLFVESEQGIVDQKNQIMQFIKNVRVSQDDKLLKGETLVYNGVDKTMTVPKDATFTAAGMAGSASEVVWNMETNTIIAEGDVSIFMESSAPTSGGKERTKLNKLTEASLKAQENQE